MDPTSRPAEAALAALADVVWTERAALEALAFKLVTLELLLGADVRRFVGRCLDEVDAAAEALERVELRRAAALEAVCGAWGRPAGSLRLSELAADAPEPWATVFADHRDALRALVAGIDHASAQCARRCVDTLEVIDDDLATLGRAARRALVDPDPDVPVSARLRLLAPVGASDGPPA